MGKTVCRKHRVLTVMLVINQTMGVTHWSFPWVAETVKANRRGPASSLKRPEAVPLTPNTNVLSQTVPSRGGGGLRGMSQARADGD